MHNTVQCTTLLNNYKADLWEMSILVPLTKQKWVFLKNEIYIYFIVYTNFFEKFHRNQRSILSYYAQTPIFLKRQLDTQLQHTATNNNTLQHTATHCNTLQHTVHHCATHCITLQHTATHCVLPRHCVWSMIVFSKGIWLLSCNRIQHTATHCSTLQHTATHCNTLQHSVYYHVTVFDQR